MTRPSALRRALFAVFLAAGTELAAQAAPPAAPSTPVAPAAGPQPDTTLTTRGSRVPIRQLGRAVATDSTTLMGIALARHLPNGGVVVNDDRKRQLVVYDSTLSRGVVIADTTTNSPNSYGLRSYRGGLIPYVADSSLFADPESGVFLVIDPQGRFTRVMAAAKAQDMFYVSSGFYGMAGFDPQGRMLYRTMRYRANRMFTPPQPGKVTVEVGLDSAPIIRADFDERKVDTLGFIAVHPDKSMGQSMANGGYYFMNVYNPLPTNDEWTVLPDGTVAIVRSRTYSIDWLSPDGKLASGPRMPFDWKRLTPEDKKRLVDSVKKEFDDMAAKQPPVPQGQQPPPRQTVVEPNELPDFYPPVRQGQVFADPQGNVWILPSTSKDAKEGLLFDVVNRRGEIVERVQLPKDRALVGFATNGDVYMARIHAPTRASLERAPVLRTPTP